MNAAELVKKHIDIANNYRTVYMWGCFGMPVTENIIREKAAQYPGWYTAAKQAELRKLIGKGYFGFDCVNLTKGILWGWNGSQNAIYGGAKYAVNGVPDVSADGMISKCQNVSTGNWEALVPGEGLWMPGHWGLYIGGGLAVECTPVWKNGVQVTAVGNLGQKSGYNTRIWKKHGRLPWVDYGNAAPAKNGEIIVNGKRYPIDRLLVGGKNYFAIREIVEVLNAAGICNLTVGNKGSVAELETKNEREKPREPISLGFFDWLRSRFPDACDREGHAQA